MSWNGTGAFLRQCEQFMHENKVGLPWIIVTRYKGNYGQAIEDIEHIDFDGYTRPTMDKGGRFIFSLQLGYKDVAMVRCKGQKARQYALDKVNTILDARGVR
jgi:hypothetical protein